MKILNKSEMLRRKQEAHIRAERDAMIEADPQWVVKLHYSFQDSAHLYLVMEFLPGGDMRSFLAKHGNLSEKQVKFYVAEIALAVDSVHRLGYIHRDIKPENLLLDARGHIKLSDFGLCCSAKSCHRKPFYENLSKAILSDFSAPNPWSELDHKQRVESWKPKKRTIADSHIGTLYFIAPEIILDSWYGPEIDWWAVGISMYEMLFGRTPFESTSIKETLRRIQNWKVYFAFPADADLSGEARDTILQFLMEAANRLGSKDGVEDVKAMPFFQDLDWAHIRELPAPIPVSVRSAVDVSNFDENTDANSERPAASQPRVKGGLYAHYAFLNYSFEETERAGTSGEGASSVK